jgi:hypothetical protein
MQQKQKKEVFPFLDHAFPTALQLPHSALRRQRRGPGHEGHPAGADVMILQIDLNKTIVLAHAGLDSVGIMVE